MLGSLSPRRVAARKLARLIAKSRPAAAPKSELKESVVGPQLDPLESLLDEELRKYGIPLV